jgi:hypothetical protein
MAPPPTVRQRCDRPVGAGRSTALRGPCWCHISPGPAGGSLSRQARRQPIREPSRNPSQADSTPQPAARWRIVTDHPLSATSAVGADRPLPILPADSARWAGVSITAVSVRRSSGSASSALSGSCVHLDGGEQHRRHKCCVAESRCSCTSSAAPLRGAAGRRQRPASGLGEAPAGPRRPSRSQPAADLLGSLGPATGAGRCRLPRRSSVPLPAAASRSLPLVASLRDQLALNQDATPTGSGLAPAWKDGKEQSDQTVMCPRGTP